MSVLTVKWVPQNGYRQHLHPQGDSQLLSLSLGGSLRSSVCLTQAPFKLLPLHWGLEHVKLLIAESLFPLALRYVSPVGLKARCSEGLLSWGKTPGLGSLMWGSDPLLLGENYAIVIIFPFVGCTPGGVGLDYTMSLPLPLILFWFLLKIFSCGKSFLLVFRSFS